MEKQPAILVIDDEPDIVKILTERLKKRNFRVFSTTRSSGGLELAMQEKPDLILLDVMMPGLSGYDVKERLSQEPMTRDIPVIFLSARGELSDKLQGFGSGVDDYVTKPFEFEELTARINAIVRKRAFYEEISFTDPLTGLANQRIMERELRQHFLLAQRYRRSFCLLVIDINDFKLINDSRGHRYGDRVLKKFSSLLNRVFRKVDIVTRYGGDEFVVLMPETHEAQARNTLKRLESAVAESFADLSATRAGGGFSISCGLAVYRSEYASEKEMFEAADKNMYEEKNKKPSVKRASRQILVVEDEPDIRKAICFRLRHAGFNVAETTDGITALESAKRLRPGLIILDLMLPGLQGEAVCKAIREDEDESFSTTPIIMLTAKGSDADRVIGRVIGANAYLKKPFQASELLDYVRKLTEGSR